MARVYLLVSSKVAIITAILAALAFAAPAWGVSTDRAGNLFSADEDIVLNTAATGQAVWTLTNDYGETISGTAPVGDGKVHISTYGLRFGRYTFAIDGDGQVTGGVVAPLAQVHPDLAPLIFAPFRLHWDNPEEALMWRQLGAWEVRYEFGLDGMNPEPDKFVFSPAIDKYMQALADQGIRPTFKVNGPPRWNDSSTVARKHGEPKDYAAFEDTFARFIRHYRQFGIDRYYIINEPEAGGWWSAGWDGYNRFLHSCNKVIKGVDKGLLTVGPNSWSNQPGFVDPVLTSGDVEILAGHYPIEKDIGNVHGYFYFTRMRKTGVNLPFINAEDFSRWRSNLTLDAKTKNSPGVVGYSTLWGVGPVMMANMEVGAYRVVELHLMYDQEPWPFERWSAGDIVPGPLCFQHRAISDQFAGTRFLRRVHEAPPSVLAWLFQRGDDRFVGAYTPVGQMTQMMEITTAARWLRVFDCFGNVQVAEAVDGKVRVLLTNADIYVHGLTPADTFAFMPRAANEPPQINNPGTVFGGANTPLQFRLYGFDGDADLINKKLPVWKLVKSPAGMTVRPGSGFVEWTPAKPGQESVTVSLTDADGASVEHTFTVQILPADADLPSRFISRATHVAVKGGKYTYRPEALDPKGGEVAFELKGPAGMKLADGVVTWTPDKLGVFPVEIAANAPGGGARTTEKFKLVVCPNPDHPAEGMDPPRIPTDLTVVPSEDGRVTLVWNPHSFAEHVVQRATSPDGPWAEVAVTKDNWFTDQPPGGPAYYRVIARNAGGDSEPSAIVSRDLLPLADAGPSAKLDAPGEMRLDGRRSKQLFPVNVDVKAAPLKYAWTVVAAPDGASPKLDNAAEARPTLSVDKPGRYLVALRVSNMGGVISLPDYAWVVVGVDELERVTWAGADRVATVGDRVMLQAGTSSPSIKLAGWFWRWDDSPFHAYSGIQNNSKRTAFLKPELPGVYRINLWPKDDRTYGYVDDVRVIVKPNEE